MSEARNGIPEIIDRKSVIRVLDFASMPESIDSESKFRNAVGQLVDPGKLSIVFPRVFNHKYLREERPGFFDKLTPLPGELLDSGIYDPKPELRGPMEEIILATNSQRKENGFPLLEITGDNWSQFFKSRLSEIKNNLPKNPSNTQPGPGSPVTTESKDEAPVISPSEPSQPALQIDSYALPGSSEYRKNSRDETVIKGKVLQHKRSR